MAAVHMQFPTTEEAIRDLRAGDEVTVDGLSPTVRVTSALVRERGEESVRA